MGKQHSPRFLQIVEETRPRVEECTVQDVRERQLAGTAPLLIDVREDHEWSRGHLPGATHLGRGVLERDIEALVPDSGTEIILYCGGGFRSVLAADNLSRMGYTNVVSMDGGFRGWQEAGHPIEASPRVVIRVRDDGPLVATGEVDMVDGEGRPLPVDRAKGNIALCRCGQSGNVPFCDGSHKQACFASRVRAGE